MSQWILGTYCWDNLHDQVNSLPIHKSAKHDNVDSVLWEAPSCMLDQDKATVDIVNE